MFQHQQQRNASAIVLVVENDVLKRVHSAAALRRQGFQVFEATDTTEAITILNKIAVDVLFSDASLDRRWACLLGQTNCSADVLDCGPSEVGKS